MKATPPSPPEAAVFDTKTIDRASDLSVEDAQFRRFKRQLAEVSVHSKYYAQRFAELGIKPSDFNSWDDLTRLPTLETKTLLENNADFPAVPPARLRRVIVSGGTTGSPKICYLGDNIREITEVWAPVWKAAGLTNEDIVAVLCPLPLASGLIITELVEEIGCTSLPVGLTTPPEFAARLMAQLGATAIVSQPSTLQLFAEQIKAFGYEPRKLGVKKALLGSEVLTESIRSQIEQEWNCEVFDVSGSSEVGMIGAECSEHDGQHLAVGSAYFEVLDLETGERVREGMGRLFITTLLNLGLPLLRYDMKDIVKITHQPCACGRTSPRIRFMGRSDDRFILKTGVKFYSYQVDAALSAFDKATLSYNVIASNDQDTDSIKLVVEVHSAVVGDAALKRELSQAIVHSSVDFNELYCAKLVKEPEIELVSIGALERTPRGKIKNRFRDLRSA